MSEETTLEAYSSKEELVANIVEAFEETIKDLLLAKDSVHIALTGGTIANAVYEAIDSQYLLDWSKVHFWWSDERFVPSGDAQRNEGQATQLFLARVNVPEQNIHRMPAADSQMSLEQAAENYQTELAHYFGSEKPSFDLALLGVGPDAHIASLFPHLPGITTTGRNVIAVTNSPKPPSERISLTLEAINAAERIWVLASGSDKAQAIFAAFTEVDPSVAPVSAVAGTTETVFFTDEDAVQQLIDD